MLKNIRKIIDKTLEENPGLVRPDCIYKKKYDNGEENLTFYNLIDKALDEGLESICDLKIINGYCTDCPYKKSSDS